MYFLSFGSLVRGPISALKLVLCTLLLPSSYDYESTRAALTALAPHFSRPTLILLPVRRYEIFHGVEGVNEKKELLGWVRSLVSKC